MQLHQLKAKHKKKQKKRVGRGGKRGTYSGRGMKGQKARAGAKLTPPIRAAIKRYPKLRGYRFKTISPQPVVLNIDIIEKKFQPGETVSPETLFKKKLIRKIKGSIPSLKILGRGKLTKKVIVENCQLSKTAKEKIKKAGGNMKVQSSELRARGKEPEIKSENSKK